MFDFLLAVYLPFIDVYPFAPFFNGRRHLCQLFGVDASRKGAVGCPGKPDGLLLGERACESQNLPLLFQRQLAQLDAKVLFYGGVEHDRNLEVERREMICERPRRG